MHVSSKLLISLLSLLLLSCRPTQQLTRWKNKLRVETFSYGPDSTYARAIAIQDDHLYTGNSNGIIYSMNLLTDAKANLNTISLQEIRDIHVTAEHIIGMQSGDTSRMIYIDRTTAKLQERILQVSTHPVFLDGMDILPSGTGFMMGDPVGGYFSLYTTQNSGKDWQEILPKLPALEGEAGFAASGTNVQCLDDSTFVFVSGGMQSRFFRSGDHGKTWQIKQLPYPGAAGSGAFSVHFVNAKEGVIVGGDYTNPSAADTPSFYTRDGGNTWKISEKTVSGYRSCVIEYRGAYYACGTTGIDISLDKGISWHNIRSGNFISMAGAGKYLYLTIPGGKVSRINAF